MSAEPAAPQSLALAKLEREAKRTRKAFLAADAAALNARAAHRLDPSHKTLEAQDLAERGRRQKRAAWLSAIDDLEIAQTGGAK